MQRKTEQCVCLYCGNDFFTTKSELKRGGGKFCNRQCSSKFRITTIEKRCEYCGRIFKPIPAKVKLGYGRFCSQQCFGASHKGLIECKCHTCGKSVFVKPCKLKEGYNIYCSKKCRWANHVSIDCKCQNCGKIFMTVPSKIKNGGGKYCSPECSQQGSSNRYFGENHFAWKGGKSDKRGENWKRQRRLAYNRDAGICQICHKKPNKNQRQFDVHHIKPYREFNGDYLSANELSNLITLCRDCHKKVEHGKIPTPKHLF